MTDLTFLHQAIQLARDHSMGGGGGPFGAVIVRDAVVVGRGWNRVVENRDPTAHAEVLAIRAAARRLGTHVLDNCTIYCSCEPCPMCLAAIYWSRIPDVVFAGGGEDAKAAGFDDAFIATELRLDWKDRTIGSNQALREEGRKVLEEWAKDPNRVEY